MNYWIKSKKVIFSFVFLAIILITYLFWQFVIAGNSFVPDEFLRARQEGAVISTLIVDLSQDSAESLKKINELEREGRIREAIDLVLEEVENNEEMKRQAYELSLRLATMADNLSEIKPQAATEAAMMALNSEAALIIRLLNYNALLAELLSGLEGRLRGEIFSSEQISDLIGSINSEAEVINDLNRQYLESMEEFKRLVR